MAQDLSQKCKGCFGSLIIDVLEVQPPQLLNAGALPDIAHTRFIIVHYLAPEKKARRQMQLSEIIYLVL
jgi:hypothetical protein